MEMHNPPHPGEILWSLYIEPLNITITKVASALGVSRKTLSELINQKSGVSAEMALRLSIAFKTTPQLWLNLQVQHDIWIARKNLKKLKVQKLAA